MDFSFFTFHFFFEKSKSIFQKKVKNEK